MNKLNKFLVLVLFLISFLIIEIQAIQKSQINTFYGTEKGGIVGYECENSDVSVTTISLLDTPDCISNNDLKPVKTKVKIAITQTDMQEKIDFIRCHGTIDYMITRCGKAIDQVQKNSIQSQLVKFDASVCNKLVKTGIFQSPYQSLPTLLNEKDKQILTSSFLFTGRVDPQTGSCEPGEDISIEGIHYTRPIINAKIIIYYSEGKGQLDVEKRQLIFPNGARCNYESQECHHSDYGFLYWEKKTPVCSDSNTHDFRSLVYIGWATKFNIQENGIEETFIQANSGNYEFQLKLTGKEVFVCDFPSHSTEHPRLFVTVLDQLYSERSFPLKQSSESQANLLTYINSKMMYSLRHTRGEVMRLFETFRIERCKMQNKISENLLTLAILSPRDFAYQYFSSPGYTAVTRGEVIHIAKCNPVLVIPDISLKHCYDELPVIYKNKTKFLTPRSRIIVNNGKIVHCTPNLNSQFYINKWVSLTSTGLMRVENPKILTNDNMTYDFEVLGNLATGGLYSRESMEKMQNTLLSPYEESIISSRVVTALKGDNILPVGYKFFNILSEKDITDISNKLETKWDWLVKELGLFGQIFSTLIGFVIVIKCISYIISSVVNFVLLKKDRGTLVAVLCFWWDSCAHHILNQKLEIPVNKSKCTSVVIDMQPRVNRDERDYIMRE